MVRILFVVMSLFSAPTFAQFSNCLPGDTVVETVPTQSIGFCTVQAYCTKYDFDLRWNYDQKYFNVHGQCAGERVCTGYDITCKSKGSGVNYRAYKQYACGKCYPTGKDY